VHVTDVFERVRYVLKTDTFQAPEVGHSKISSFGSASARRAIDKDVGAARLKSWGNGDPSISGIRPTHAAFQALRGGRGAVPSCAPPRFRSRACCTRMRGLTMIGFLETPFAALKCFRSAGGTGHERHDAPAGQGEKHLAARHGRSAPSRCGPHGFTDPLRDNRQVGGGQLQVEVLAAIRLRVWPAPARMV